MARSFCFAVLVWAAFLSPRAQAQSPIGQPMGRSTTAPKDAGKATDDDADGARQAAPDETERPRQTPPAPDPSTAPQGSRPKRAVPPADPQPEQTGWSNTTSALTQYAVGTACSWAFCGTTGPLGGAIAAVVFWIPYVGLVSSVAVLAIFGCGAIACAPPLGASLGVWTAEAFGHKRGTWAWPVLAFYGAELADVVVMAVGTAAGALITMPFFASIVNTASFDLFNPGSWINPINTFAWPALIGGGLVSGVAFSAGLVGAILLPSLASTLTYQYTSEERAPDDTGFRMPGLFSPNGVTEQERAEKAREEQRRIDAKERARKKRIHEQKKKKYEQKMRERRWREEQERKKRIDEQKQQQREREPRKGDPLTPAGLTLTASFGPVPF